MSVTVHQHKNFIGGEWLDSDGGTMEVFNPATGEVIAELPRSTEADVQRAVDAAKKALPEWLEKTPKDRMELLLRFLHVLDAAGCSRRRPRSSRGSRTTSCRSWHCRSTSRSRRSTRD